ncbi:MAG: 7-cyano-7-deazaguanine synthase, partial [Candidatus Sumerlaeota bacterium]
AGDHTIYPDCRPEFIAAMREAAALCDWEKIELYAPFQNMSKAEIAAHGAELGVPFEKTWSCYKGLALHCGRCGTCVERKEAFQNAGLKDPTEYAEGN